MTLIRHHYFRFIYILCGLVFLSACEQKNLLPTPTTPNQLAEDTIVIELDLTQKKAQPSTQPNKTSSTVTSNKNKDLTTLLAITPTTPSITPQVPVDQTIIEIKYADPALPAHLNNELQKIYQTPTIVRQTSLLDMANRILIMGYAQSSAKLLNQIDLDKLPENQLGRYLEAKAESQLMLGDSFGAIVWLRQAQVLAPNKDPLAMAKRLTLKAQAYEANGLSLAASKALIALSQLPTTLDPSQYNERIWSALTQINANKLSQSITTASSDTARAWYNLALLPLLHHDLDLQLTA
ncbi:MAG: hypothetical protein ACI9EP_000132, partial [Oceanospirillaceae bacterium]